MTSVLIAEDHAIVRQALRERIESLGYRVVAETGTAAEALELARSLEPDILVLDLTMPGDSFETISQLRSSQPRPRILVLTALEEDSVAVRCLRAGVDAFLYKSEPAEKLAEALARLSAGHRFVSGHLASLLVTAIDVAEEPHTKLSEREAEVARSIAGGQTVTDIAKRLELSVKTVSTYRTRVLEKLGVANDSELIRYWLRVEPGA